MQAEAEKAGANGRGWQKGADLEAERKPGVQRIDWDHPQDADDADLQLGPREVLQLHGHLVDADWQCQQHKQARDEPCL